MWIYIVVALFPLLIARGYVLKLAPESGLPMTRKQRRTRFWTLAVAALPMFLVIALRDASIGADTGMYLGYFTTAASMTWEEFFIYNALGPNFEFGFAVFLKLCATVTKSPHVYQVLYTSIYFFAVVHFANRLEKGNFLFLYFFATHGVYTFMFTGVRQCLAMSICLFAYDYIKRRKFFRFLLVVLLAMSFHQSAIFFILAYPVFKNRMNVKNTLLYSLITLLLLLNLENLIYWLNDLFGDTRVPEDSTGGFIFLLVVFLVTVFAAFVLKNYKGITYESQGLFNINVLALSLWILRLAEAYAERVSFYFLFFSAAMLSVALVSIANRRDRLLLGTLACVFSMFLFVYKFFTNFASFVPYNFFF